MHKKIQRLWRFHIQRATFQVLSVLMLREMAFCQSWLKRRHDLRKKCRINVSIKHDGLLWIAVMSDISLCGARIEGRHDLNPGDRVQLRFEIHYLESSVDVIGTVVWAKGESLGLRFD